MKNTKLILGGLLVVALVLAAIFVLPNFFSDSGNVQALNKIVYACGDDITSFNICAINTDGTEFVQLTNIEEDRSLDPNFTLTRFSNPHINGAAQVVFQCHGQGFMDIGDRRIMIPGGVGKVCASDLDGANFRELAESHFQIEPQINDAGQVYYHCRVNIGSDQDFAEPGLCRIKHDGTDQVSLVEDFSYLSNFRVSGSGSLVYTCYFETADNPDGRGEICSIDPRTGNTRRLTNDLFDNQDPMITNGNRIYFYCDQFLVNGVCSIDSNGQNRIKYENSDQSYWDVNNRNELVIHCNQPTFDEVCLLDVQGEEIARIPYEAEYEGHLKMNDAGVVAFVCNGKNLCVIDINTGKFSQITTDGNVLAGTIPGGISIR